MKKLTVILRYAAKVNNIICKENGLDEALTRISSDEWMFKADKDEEVSEIEEALKFYLGMEGIPEEKYEIEIA